MAIKFETVKAGDVLYDCHRVKMGNTTASRMGTWVVKVIALDEDGRGASVQWNGNRATRWTRRQVERLRRTPSKAPARVTP